jgi:hypothetical protein
MAHEGKFDEGQFGLLEPSYTNGQPLKERGPMDKEAKLHFDTPSQQGHASKVNETFQCKGHQNSRMPKVDSIRNVKRDVKQRLSNGPSKSPSPFLGFGKACWSSEQPGFAHLPISDGGDPVVLETANPGGKNSAVLW